MKTIMKYKIKLKCDDDFYWSLILHILDSDFTWKEVAPVNSNSTKKLEEEVQRLRAKGIEVLKDEEQ